MINCNFLLKPQQDNNLFPIINSCVYKNTYSQMPIIIAHAKNKKKMKEKQHEINVHSKIYIIQYTKRIS